jgi:hypothetical protein
MSATVAAPLSLVPSSHAKSGLILGFSRRPGDRWPDAAVTAGRPRGVGGPDTDPNPATNKRSEAPSPELVRRAVAAAAMALGSLDRQAREVATRFRVAPGAQAQQGLTHLVESTQTLLKLAAMIARATGADLEALSVASGNAATRTSESVTALIRHQLMHEWDDVARTLDDTFVRALAAWRLVFSALDTPTDPGPMGHAA